MNQTTSQSKPVDAAIYQLWLITAMTFALGIVTSAEFFLYGAVGQLQAAIVLHVYRWFTS